MIGRNSSHSSSDSYTQLRAQILCRNERPVFTAWLELLRLYMETAGCSCIAAGHGLANVCI